MTGHAAVFAAIFCALYAAHQVGDHWVQSSAQALGKGRPGWPGRLACARHVAGLTVTKAVAVALAVLVLGLPVSLPWLAAGLAADAVTHYWADRRFTLRRLADAAGKGEFWDLGGNSNCLGTGAYALDQSWHVAWLFLAALIAAGGAR